MYTEQHQLVPVAAHAANDITAGFSVVVATTDFEFARAVKHYPRRDGFFITLAGDGRTAVQHAVSGRHNAIVLDTAMPEMDGVNALREIRRESEIPVLMVTSCEDEVTHILKLDLWADDYLPKYRSGRGLALRLCKILRRMRIQSCFAPLKAGPIELWPGKRKAACKGRSLELTSTEFTILQILTSEAGRVVTKKELSEKALAKPLAPYDRSIDVHLSKIRQKLGAFAELILTVRGHGYQLASD